MEAGSKERIRLEAELNRLLAQSHDGCCRRRGSDLAQREAQIYFDSYARMKRIVSEIAYKRGITLVLRRSKSSTDPVNLPEVNSQKSFAIHYVIDITEDVIEAMAFGRTR